MAQMSVEGDREEGQAETNLNAFGQGGGQGGKPQSGGWKGKGSSPPGGGFRADGFLTEEEYAALFKQGKCIFCFQKGHLSVRCSKKKETRRHPTAEELKA